MNESITKFSQFSNQLNILKSDAFNHKLKILYSILTFYVYITSLAQINLTISLSKIIVFKRIYYLYYTY